MDAENATGMSARSVGKSPMSRRGCVACVLTPRISRPRASARCATRPGIPRCPRRQRKCHERIPEHRQGSVHDVHGTTQLRRSLCGLLGHVMGHAAGEYIFVKKSPSAGHAAGGCVPSVSRDTDTKLPNPPLTTPGELPHPKNPVRPTGGVTRINRYPPAREHTKQMMTDSRQRNDAG